MFKNLDKDVLGQFGINLAKIAGIFAGGIVIGYILVMLPTPIAASIVGLAVLGFFVNLVYDYSKSQVRDRNRESARLMEILKKE